MRMAYDLSRPMTQAPVRPAAAADAVLLSPKSLKYAAAAPTAAPTMISSRKSSRYLGCHCSGLASLMLLSCARRRASYGTIKDTLRWPTQRCGKPRATEQLATYRDLTGEAIDDL